MALSDTILKEALKAIITSKEEFLQKRLEGGDLASIRNNDFITGNFKAEDLILLVDVGHYESEQYTKNLLFDILTKKFPNFAIALAKTNTNPVKYR